MVAVGSPDGGSRRILVLGAGPAQLGLLRTARERGLFVIAADRDPGAPGFRHADRRALVSVEDEVGIERLADAERVDGLIAPGIDWPVGVAARVAARLGLAHPIDPATAGLATSKLRQRERFSEHGVPQPRWLHVGEPDDRLGFPCVVKAPDRQGQRGLSLVRGPHELADAVAAAVAASRGRSCVIEELVDGPEVTVNAYVRGGEFHPLTVTDRVTAEPPAFGVALAHVYPSLAADAAAAEVAEAAAAALGIREGPVYVQLRIGSSGPQVVELAARLGGGHDADLCREVVGVDLNGLALSAALGEPIRAEAVRRRREQAGCVRFLVAPEGQLAAVDGLDDARALEGIVAADVYRQPGWRFEPLRRGADRAGFVLAVGESREEALARADAAAERIEFRLAPAEAVV